MFREPKAMREIRKIQEKLYEERKGLTAEQEIRLIRDNAQKMKEKYGIKSKIHATTGRLYKILPLSRPKLREFKVGNFLKRGDKS